MTNTQAKNYNKMLYTLKRIAKLYQTPSQLRKNSNKDYGLDYEETLEMAYENIKNEAADAIRHVKAIPLTDKK